MAAQKVFGICELAEQIFLELPTNDLLLVQRVCKPWKTTVQSSSVCRKALFLEPGQACDVNLEGGTRCGDVRCWSCGALFGALDKRDRDIALNPMLVHQIYLQPPFNCSPFDDRVLNAKLLDVPMDASCRQMFITQPPLPFATSAIATLDKCAREDKDRPLNCAAKKTHLRIVSGSEASPGDCRVFGGGHKLGEIMDSLQESIRPTEEICPRSSYWTIAWTEEEPANKTLGIEDGTGMASN
ncbi:uncharacterized protein MYCFIDRAFT_213345 [Pseudocercospora fijiensis CIRAD86]|uniref:F-box domain-containing protein n=1 Tax=Pseudocercospora fijiensis (strain CIRAD86) TaxID=383855 RepID=N1QBN1_PSEFD|nr:uncharacterized protein MYCFIDRAFT_213345 [Pseudocercospora fijiensis CIRAD86]EME88593.1 hypothetical protein MYCFIDRAFT_213345 [Pseudocercospora fijiensis CIRAD86]